MTKSKTPPRPPLDGQGCTPERKRHSPIKASVREITPGGMILSYGDADTEHCYLDWLRANGLLGSDEQAARDRYDAGYALRDIFFRFRSSRRDMVQSSTRSGFLPDHETDSDRAEQEYLDVMRAVPARYRLMVRSICVEEPRRFEITFESRIAVYEACEEARDALDELRRAIASVERMSR
jgi:hypothetical protein